MSLSWQHWLYFLLCIWLWQHPICGNEKKLSFFFRFCLFTILYFDILSGTWNIFEHEKEKCLIFQFWFLLLLLIFFEWKIPWPKIFATFNITPEIKHCELPKVCYHYYSAKAKLSLCCCNMWTIHLGHSWYLLPTSYKCPFWLIDGFLIQIWHKTTIWFEGDLIRVWRSKVHPKPSFLTTVKVWQLYDYQRHKNYQEVVKYWTSAPVRILIRQN